jgi:hypothetical protein
MKLFEVNEAGEAIVNKPWLSLIPEFQELFRDNYRKIRYDNPVGRKYLAYIYFVHDFSSPLRNWKEDKRVEEAIRYTGLTAEQLKNDKLKTACTYYKKLQVQCCRAHASYIAAQKGLDKMDEYFENIDFDRVDKQGKLMYTPNQYIDNISKTNKAYDELDKLAQRVETELSQSSGIRGSAELGDKELMRSKGNFEDSEGAWNEEKELPDSPISFVDLASLVHEKVKK